MSEELDNALLTLKSDLEHLAPDLRNLLASQIETGLRAMGEVVKDETVRIAVLLESMAEYARLLSLGEIERGAFDRASMRTLEAIRLAERYAENAAKSQAYLRSKRLLEGGVQILIGIMSAGLAVVAPAVGAGVAAAIGQATKHLKD